MDSDDLATFRQRILAQEEQSYSREGLIGRLDLQSVTGGTGFARVLSLCVDVLQRMPRDAVDDFLGRDCRVWWMDPDASTAAKLSSSAEGFVELLYLASNLPKYPDEVAQGVIAHEFAHVLCTHDRGGEAVESEADRMAQAWGFKPEIAAMRAHCHEAEAGSG